MNRYLPFALLALLAPAVARAQGPTPAAIANVYSFSAGQLNADTAAGDASYPQYILNNGSAQDGTWHFTSKGAWTGGFFVGSLWQEYRQTGDARWAMLARRYENAASASDTTHLQSRQFDTSTHDVGFVLINSFGNALRYGGNLSSDRAVIVQGAASLDTRFNPAVGAIKSHEDKDLKPEHQGQFQVIIDNMMNLELLFQGAELTTDATQRDTWYAHAVTHARTTIANHFGPDGTRPDDGSTYQAVYFDSATGAVLNKDTVQGISPASTWSRGQAWAVYGYTMCARYARRRGDTVNAALFLAQAQKASDYYVTHLPADSIPYWDFDAPAGDPRDSSSASIAAAGLLELSTYMTNGTKQAAYYKTAQRILASLTSPAYLAQGAGGVPPLSQSVLLHGSYNVPGSKQDQGLIWGDYFLLEGLQRYESLLAPTADAYVRSGTYASTNYGKAAALFVKAPTSAGADERWTYLKFDLKNVKGPINNARLRLYGANQVAGYAGGASVYGVGDTSWSESKLTWNTKPALSSILVSAPISSTTLYSDWDVTAWVQARRAAGKTSVSLAVKMDSPSSGKAYDSFGPREAAQNGPQLVLQTY